MKLLEIVGLPWSAAKSLLARGLKRLSRRRFPSNAALARAFEAFSRGRTPETRRQFYDALLASRLIIATRRPSGKGAALEVAEFAAGRESGLIAFAHPARLDECIPEWSESAAVEGRLLFKLAVEQKRDFLMVDLFGTRLAFKGKDLQRLASGRAPEEDPVPALLAGPGQRTWSRPDPAPCSRVLSILREEAARSGLAACCLLRAGIDGGAERTALVFEVAGEAGLAAVRRYMEAVDLRLKPEDWGGPIHVVAMTREELEPLRPLAVVIKG